MLVLGPALFYHFQHPHLFTDGGILRKITVLVALTLTAAAPVLLALAAVEPATPPHQGGTPPTTEQPVSEEAGPDAKTETAGGITPVIVEPPYSPASTPANCTQFALFDPATGRLDTNDLEACVSQINNCEAFTATLCHRYPGGTPTAGGYPTCISYIWKHMTTDDRAAFRTAIATQPLCKDIFHSILN